MAPWNGPNEQRLWCPSMLDSRHELKMFPPRLPSFSRFSLPLISCYTHLLHSFSISAPLTVCSHENKNYRENTKMHLWTDEIIEELQQVELSTG